MIKRTGQRTCPIIFAPRKSDAQAQTTVKTNSGKQSLTNLVQLKRCEVRAEFVQQLLAGNAVGAVALGEDDNAVLVDEGLSLGLSGGHGGG